MSVRQDGPHACGTRRSPCIWDKTVPMHMGQDGPHAYGTRRSPCIWDKTVPMHMGQDGPNACGAKRSQCICARRSQCIWGKTVPMHVGQDGPHACGARRSPCIRGKKVPMHVEQAKTTGEGVIDRVALGIGLSCLWDRARRFFFGTLAIFSNATQLGYLFTENSFPMVTHISVHNVNTIKTW